MANRTTATEVKAILDGCTLSDSVVDEFITAANLLVTSVLGSDTTIGSSLLSEVERWYTAHMMACTVHKTTTKEKLGDAAVEYTGVYWKQLESTPYGQMVKQLDTTGKMSNVGKRAASMSAVVSFNDRTYDHD